MRFFWSFYWMHPGFNKVFSALVSQNPGVCLPACTSSGNFSAYRLPGLCSLSSLIEPHPMYSQFSIQPKSHGGPPGNFLDLILFLCYWTCHILAPQPLKTLICFINSVTLLCSTLVSLSHAAVYKVFWQKGLLLSVSLISRITVPYCLIYNLKKEISRTCLVVYSVRGSPVPVTPLWPEAETPIALFY